MRRLLPIVAVAVALLVGAVVLSDPYRGWRARSRVPRIVVVTLDTLQVNWTSLFNADVDNTPRLQALADRGVVFDHAYTRTPITLPAHTGLFTGRDPAEVGVFVNGHVVPPESETLAEIASAYGYRTAAFVSLGVLSSTFGLDQGFDLYQDRTFGRVERWYLTADEVTGAAGEWVAENADDPFLLWVHLSDPHEPYVEKGAPPDVAVTLDGEELGRFNLTSKEIHWIRFPLPAGRHRLTFTSLRPRRPDDTGDTSLRLRFTKRRSLEPWVADPDLDLDGELDLRSPATLELDNPGDAAEEVFAFFRGRLASPPRSEVWEAYPKEVAWMDRHLGALEDRLAELGLAEDTLWVVVSDHGEGLFNHLILGHADFVHEDQLRMLWLLAGPGVEPGLRIDAPGALTDDVLPTVLELVGLPRPEAATGRSWVPCWRGRECSGREEWWARGASYEPLAISSIAGYRWPYKILWQPDPASGCYRVDDDPWETENLCKLYTRDRSLMPDEVAVLDDELPRRRAELERALAAVGSGTIDDEQRELLESLGYLGN